MDFASKTPCRTIYFVKDGGRGSSYFHLCSHMLPLFLACFLDEISLQALDKKTRLLFLQKVIRNSCCTALIFHSSHALVVWLWELRPRLHFEFCSYSPLSTYEDTYQKVNWLHESSESRIVSLLLVCRFAQERGRSHLKQQESLKQGSVIFLGREPKPLQNFDF